jgi:RHS repeat-associated protein
VLFRSVGYDDNRRATSYNYTGTKVYTPTEWKNGKPKKYEWLPTNIGFEYAYDKEDNKLYEKRTHEGKGDAYVYDAIYRLTGVKYGVPNLNPATDYADYLIFDKKEEFDLDGVGNREQVRTQNAQLITQDYSTNNLNQYTAIDGLAPRYDLNGNMTFDGMNNVVYDYANRPVRFENVAFIVDVTYDALGRRLQKKVTTKASGETRIEGYILDGVRVISDLDESGNSNKDYIWGIGIDELLATAKGRSTNYDFYLRNSLGSVTHIVNKDAEVEESYKYTVYGLVTIYDRKGEETQKSKSKNRYLFTGREYDSETGLYYYRARYYSPNLGRFLQRDPINWADPYFNLYTYTLNNPNNKIDSFGTNPKEPETTQPKHPKETPPDDRPLTTCWCKIREIAATKGGIDENGKKVDFPNATNLGWKAGAQPPFTITIKADGDIRHVKFSQWAWFVQQLDGQWYYDDETGTTKSATGEKDATDRASFNDDTPPSNYPVTRDSQKGTISYSDFPGLAALFWDFPFEVKMRFWIIASCTDGTLALEFYINFKIDNKGNLAEITTDLPKTVKDP